MQLNVTDQMFSTYQAYGQPAAYGQGTAAPPPMDAGYNNEAYFPFGHPSRQASSSGPKRKKEVPYLLVIKNPNANAILITVIFSSRE